MTPRERGVSVEVLVPFHDVDALRVVWHGHYYKYFEVARTALLRSRGLDAPEVVALGYGMLVVESHCRYIHPLRYGDRATVTAWFGDVDHRILVAYAIHNLARPDGRRVARGRTALVTTDAAGALLLETPDAIRSRILA